LEGFVSNLSPKEWKLLAETQVLYHELHKHQARVQHFKANFEEQKQTLLERVRHASNMAQVDQSIETFFEKVFDEPHFPEVSSFWKKKAEADAG
jgi:hypothetical protein